MKKIFLCILSTVFLHVSPNFFSTSFAWDYMQWSYNVSVLIWMLLVFSYIPIARINERSLVAAACTAQAIEIMVFPIWFFWPVIDYFTWPIFLISMAGLFYYVSTRAYTYRSDDISDDCINILFYPPRKGSMIFKSLIGSPFGSVCIYTRGSVYGFRWKSGRFERYAAGHRFVNRRFIVYNTRIQAEALLLDRLEAMVGKTRPLSWLKYRCILELRPFLGLLGDGYSPRFLEMIPSLYAVKVFGKKR